LLGALANSRGHRHEENAAKLVNAALELPLSVGAALLASAEGYTPRATQLIEAARDRLGTLDEVAEALAENLPAPKLTSGRSRRRKRRKRKKAAAPEAAAEQAQGDQTQAAESQPAQESHARAGPAETGHELEQESPPVDGAGGATAVETPAQSGAAAADV
jgi:hypothetical protein